MRHNGPQLTGERKSVLAKEFGISRETVYSYLRTATTADITG